jgi:hypothetical protein
MDYPLHEYAKVLQGFMEREASLPVSGLEPLANAGIALHNMIVVQSLDDEYGDRAEHLSRLKALYTVCMKRYMKEKDFHTRCRLVHTMQLLANEPFASCIPLIEKCSDLSGQFIGQEIATHRECALPQWLWCIAYWHYPVDGEPIEDDDFLCFKRHLAQWAHDLHGKDHWPELSTAEALRRMELLNANACMFNEDAYNEIIRSLYAYYREHTPIVATTERESLQAMGALYGQAVDSKACPVDLPTKEAVVQAMKDSLGLLPAASDEWLYVFSFLVADLCEAVMSEP